MTSESAERNSFGFSLGRDGCKPLHYRFHSVKHDERSTYGGARNTEAE